MPYTRIEDPDKEPQPEQEIVVQAEVVVEREEHEPEEYETGTWHWVKDDDDPERLVCIVGVGSNYIKVASPLWRSSWRIHITEWPKVSRPEPNYKEYINERITECRQRVQSLLNEAKEITRRLGVTPQQLLTAEEKSAANERALSTVTGVDPNEYKKALIKAKEEDLPEIFRKVESANRKLANWMSSETLPLDSQLKVMRKAKEKIDSKIFNVSIYAGLQEGITQISEGEPAPYSEKLHVMQRKLYMDEECLLGYKHGGLEFNSIGAFDAWLAEPENRDRILPHQRSLVVMQVRRHTKERPAFGSLRTAMINVELAYADKINFIYIRNGENLYRIMTDLEFPSKTFPDKDMFNMTEPMYAYVSHSSVDLIPARTYDQAKKEYEEEVRQYRLQMAKFIKWNRAHGVKDVTSTFSGDVNKDNPYWDWNSLRRPNFAYKEYRMVNDSFLKFDEVKEHLEKKAEQHNRIALIIQGLLDRSDILHPHPPICIWKASDFNACIELVYDHDYVLYEGDPPDIAAYLYENNQKIGKGSLVIGQDDYWARCEAEKENNRRDRHYNDTSYRPDRVRPYGNPGPGDVCYIKEWKSRARKAVFRWHRERQRYNRYGNNAPIKCKLEVPAEELFCIDAYKPGDYLQFFKDPRTRSQYMKWAPVMLLAEEVHAGNFDVETGLMKKLNEKGWEPDGEGGHTRTSYFKGKKIVESLGREGGWSKETHFGNYDGPEGDGPDGPPSMITGEEAQEEDE